LAALGDRGWIAWEVPAVMMLNYSLIIFEISARGGFGASAVSAVRWLDPSPSFV
jgi:hypothetical protein